MNALWITLLVLGIIVLLVILVIAFFVLRTVFRVFKKIKSAKTSGLLSLDSDETKIETDEDDDLNIEKITTKHKTDKGKKKMYVMNLDGVIQYETEPKSSYQNWVEMLKKTLADKPAALLVRVNSPGGTVAATQEIYNLIESVRNNGTIVIVLMEDVAASGGLYASMAGDKIVANSGTITGSAGVIMQNMNYGALLKKYDLKMVTIKAGKNKDIMSPVHDMTVEQKGILEEMVLDTHNQFLNCISERRNIARDQMSGFDDARILTGNQALKLGLIDKLGGHSAAVVEAVKLLKLKDSSKLKEVTLRQAQSPIEKFLGKNFIKAILPSFLHRIDPVVEELALRGPLWLMPR